VYSKETTTVSQIFGGYMQTEGKLAELNDIVNTIFNYISLRLVTCGECANRSVTFQYFQDLILDIEKSDNVCDALNDYFEGEQLPYVCDKCQREVVAEKKFSLEKAPNVLCVQLKRLGKTIIF